jgi:hypothetical protein
LNNVALEGIGAARQASPLLEVESGATTAAFVGADPADVVAGAGVDVGVDVGVAAVAGGGVVIEAGGAVVESLEEPPSPQPPSAATKNRSASLLNAPNAFELIPMPPVPV